ncbi:MAG: LCP family protein [Clostridia bacterium]|nr:LCP family protein [Clostridia bacterium]
MAETVEKKEKNKKNRSRKIILIVLISLLALLLTAGIVGGAYFLPLYRAYRSSLETIPIIERPDDLTVPDSPDIEIITVDAGEWTYEDDTGEPYYPDTSDNYFTEPVDPSSSYATETASPPDDTTSPPVDSTVTQPGTTGTPSVSTANPPATTAKPPVTTAKPPVTTSPPTVTTAKPPVTSPPATQPVYTAPESTEVPHALPSTGIYRVARMDPNVENILLIGLDTRNPYAFDGRSDCMIVLSFNKKTGDVKLISLLRDILVPISGHGWNRLNSAYAFGGAALCINTINDYFGLDIQKYATVNFACVVILIDKCGGVDLELTEVERQHIGGELQSLGNGKYHLNGNQAKAYMSDRSTIGADFDRTQRQRNVLMALYRKLMAEKKLSEILDIIESGFAYVRTNIPLNDLFSLATSVYSFGSSLKLSSDKIPCNGSFSFGYYNKMAIININRSSNIAYLKKIIWNK